MDTKKLEVFMHIAEVGNVTKAAAQLGYTQSAASHIISGLEDEFGFQLFTRSKSGMSLTENGRCMYPLLQEVVHRSMLAMNMADEINGLQLGYVRVGTFTSVAAQWMPSIIKGFALLYPHIHIEISDGNYSDVEKWIADGLVDCGFVVQTTQQPFEIAPLRQERMLVILPTDHPLCRLDKIPLSALRQENLIVPAEGVAYEVGCIMRHAGMEISRSASFVSDFSVIAMVRGGLGISILPELILKDIVRDGLEARPLEAYGTRTICTAVACMKNASPACRRFLRYVWDWSSGRL